MSYFILSFPTPYARHIFRNSTLPTFGSDLPFRERSVVKDVKEIATNIDPETILDEDGNRVFSGAAKMFLRACTPDAEKKLGKFISASGIAYKETSHQIIGREYSITPEQPTSIL